MSQFYPRPHPNSSRAGEASHDLAGASAGELNLHYHKGLEHDAAGRVKPAKFEKFRKALDKHNPADFANIELFGDGTPAEGKSRRLVNPQAGLAADRETVSCWHLDSPKPPEQAGHKETTAAEMIELYWMAYLRDLPFAHFEDPTKNADLLLARDELKALKLYIKPPASGGHPNTPIFEAHPALDAGSIFRRGELWPASPEHSGPWRARAARAGDGERDDAHRHADAPRKSSAFGGVVHGCGTDSRLVAGTASPAGKRSFGFLAEQKIPVPALRAPSSDRRKRQPERTDTRRAGQEGRGAFAG